MITKLRLAFLLIGMLGINYVFAQTEPAPTLHYPTPPAYYLNTAMKPLVPVSTNIDTPAYGGGGRGSNGNIAASTGVASDAAGNIFIAGSSSQGLIYKMPLHSSDAVLIASDGFKQAGIAVDAAGNIFIADLSHNTIDKITLSDTTYSKPVAIASGFKAPYGIAVDAAGNLYVGDSGNNLVKKIAFNGSKYSAPVAIGSGFNNPCQVAVDAAGNVYVADNGNSAIKKIPVGGGAPISIGTGIVSPVGVALDYAGNVFALENSPVNSYQNNLVKEILAGGSATIIIASSRDLGACLTIDPFGYIYFAEPQYNWISETVPVGGYYLNKALPLGMSFSSETGVISGTPTVTSPVTTYIVSAYQAYNVSIKTSFSFGVSTGLNIGTLSGLAISSGTLSPEFATGTKAYTAVVAGSVTSLTLTPTATAFAASITVNGTAVATGTASAAIPLVVGTNVINTVVTSNDGTATATYQLTVTRQPDNNANLAHLVLSSGSLSPTFGAYVNTYTANVFYGTSSVTLKPTLADGSATVTVNGTPVAPGTPSGAIALNVGANAIATVVTAFNGVTKKTYTVTVNRASFDPDLSGLTISNGTLTQPFTPSTTLDSAFVGNGLKTFTVTPTAPDPAAVITVNGTVVASGTPSQYLPLTVGFNTITIVVTAGDGVTQKTYTLLVNEARSSVNSLSGLVLSTGPLTPAFIPNTKGPVSLYYQTVEGNISAVTITPTATDPTATIAVDGTVVTSGTAFPPIPLTLGPDNLTQIIVTAQNQTTNTIDLFITRIATNNTELASLVASKGTISPGNTGYFNDMVTNGTTSLTISPVAADPGAIVTVNGVGVKAGSASGPIALTVGNNTINIVVTSFDGTTQQTYIVNVVRPSTNAKLSGLDIGSPLTPAFNSNITSYTASVPNSVSDIDVKATVSGGYKSITVDGQTVQSGDNSYTPTLAVGANTITIVVTAQDGVTTDTYMVTVTRAAAGANIPDATVSVDKPTETPRLADDGITVHQGVSPNGDGINDFLQIDNISNYPENHLSIMNRNGQLVYESKGYDNATKVFDGHSNKTGQMQLPGTYFYSLDYTVKGIIKHKTGFLVLKY